MDVHCKTSAVTDLRSINEIPCPYRSVFSQYPSFNIIQSSAFQDSLHTNNSLVLSAPTGSGKTVIFELAIVRHLISCENTTYSNLLKIIYIAPLKALCEERLIDWHRKFSNFGLKCISATGDSDIMDMRSLLNHNVIITTPEKWDSLTRKWKENQELVKVVKLFMIDEVHLLNEDIRGSTLETIVNRMKIIQNAIVPSNEDSDKIICNQKMRFIALSATFPNIDDIAEWLGGTQKAKCFKFSADIRPVKLNTVVIGYNTKCTTPFKFDLSLNYKLQSLIMQYSFGKPTLIFCNTRKSVEMTATHIAQSLTIVLDASQKQILKEAASKINDTRLKSVMVHGIGYHHGGVMMETRHVIEDLFKNGNLPVLVTTSTLSMGINLPAHLVIVKSTKYYDKGGYQDYTTSALLQMIGRAGRPQFDKHATALILTTNADKAKFEKLMAGEQSIESNLHKHLTEHLNAEVVLHTITDLDVAMQWLSSTFLYIRAQKNPRYYGLSIGLSVEQIDKKLLEMCQIELNRLVKAGMITMNQDIIISPTDLGSLMAKYYIAFETMKLFSSVTGTEILQQILALISKCHEFSAMTLRVGEKKCLNLLNNPKNKFSIRFPLSGKIKTLDMKINCIIQAVFGCLEITDCSVLTEALKVVRNGERICKCLIEYLEIKNIDKCFPALLNTIILSKCFQTQLWENSPHLTKQLPGIGPIMSTQMKLAGKTTFQTLSVTNPRDIEMIVKKKPPMGNKILDMVKSIPKYTMGIEEMSKIGKESIVLRITIDMVNHTESFGNKSPVTVNSMMWLLVGDNLNRILLYEKYMHSYMMEYPQVIRDITINDVGVRTVEAHFISDNFVGIDCNCKYTIGPESKCTPKSKTKAKILQNILLKNGINEQCNAEKKYLQTSMDMFMKSKKVSTVRAKELSNRANKPDKKVPQISPTKDNRPMNGDNEDAIQTALSVRETNAVAEDSRLGVAASADNNVKNDVAIEKLDPFDLENEIPSIYTKYIPKRNEGVECTSENKKTVSAKLKSYQAFENSLCISPEEVPASKSLKIEQYKFKPAQFSHNPPSSSKRLADSTINENAKKHRKEDELLQHLNKYIQSSDDSKEKKRCMSDNFTKSIKWRSPLVHSPSVRFSPKISTPFLPFPENDVTQQNETCNNTFHSNTPPRKLLPIIPQLKMANYGGKNSAGFMKLNTTTGTKFPLSDKDYRTNERLPEQDSNRINEGAPPVNKSRLEDYISEPLLEFIKSKETAEQNVSSRKEIVCTSANTSLDYYSRIISQSEPTPPKTLRSKNQIQKKNSLSNGRVEEQKLTRCDVPNDYRHGVIPKRSSPESVQWPPNDSRFGSYRGQDSSFLSHSFQFRECIPKNRFDIGGPAYSRDSRPIDIDRTQSAYRRPFYLANDENGAREHRDNSSAIVDFDNSTFGMNKGDDVANEGNSRNWLNTPDRRPKFGNVAFTQRRSVPNEMSSITSDNLKGLRNEVVPFRNGVPLNQTMNDVRVDPAGWNATTHFPESFPARTEFDCPVQRQQRPLGYLNPDAPMWVERRCFNCFGPPESRRFSTYEPHTCHCDRCRLNNRKMAAFNASFYHDENVNCSQNDYPYAAGSIKDTFHSHRNDCGDKPVSFDGSMNAANVFAHRSLGLSHRFDVPARSDVSQLYRNNESYLERHNVDFLNRSEKVQGEVSPRTKEYLMGNFFDSFEDNRFD